MTDPGAALDSARVFASTYLVPAGLRIGIAILVFVVGRWIAKGLLRASDRVMERGKVDVSVRKFLGSVLYAVMFLALAVVALDTVGVRTTAIVALVGAAGITIGLALQGSLSNLAAGVVLIMFRPYKVGDTVTIGKYTGKVDALKVFNTVLVTGDAREITLPNALILTGPIENLTVLGRRRVDLVVTVATDRDLTPVKELLARTAAAGARAETEPPVTVDVAEVTAAGVRLRVRTWVATEACAALATQQIEALRAALIAESLPATIALEQPA